MLTKEKKRPTLKVAVVPHWAVLLTLLKKV